MGFSALIEHIDIGGSLDARTKIEHASIVRRWSFGDAWNEVRVGLRIAIEDTEATISDQPRLVVGACSGDTNPYNDGATPTTNFLGFWTNRVFWGRATNNYIVGDGSTGRFQIIERNGITTTEGSVPNTGTNRLMHSPGERAAYIWVDVKKGSPYQTRCLVCTALSSTSIYKSHTDLLNDILGSEPADHTLSSYTNAPAAFDPANGPLNAVNISWDRIGAAIHIPSVVVARLS